MRTKTRKVRIQDVAKKAGVSVCTVSRVFNKHPYVKADVTKKVLDVARKLNYKPRFKAVEDRISILVESTWMMTYEGYEGVLLSSILKNIMENGYSFDIVPLYESNFQFERFSKACIAVLTRKETVEKIKMISKVPVVTINHIDPDCHSVCSNHYQGLELAVNHLVDLGHEKIAFINHDSQTWGNEERLRGYKETLTARGIELNNDFIGFYEESTLFEILAKTIQKGATSLIISGENRAAQSIHHLSLLGKKIPDDISVITFESEKLSRFLLPPNTTISQNLINLGKIAVDTTIDLIQNNYQEPVRIMTENQLIIRESTAKPQSN